MKIGRHGPGCAAVLLVLFMVAVVAGAALLSGDAHAATVVNMDSSGLLNAPKVDYCASTPTVPYAADGDPITVHMPPGPNFVIGQAPATWWKNPPTSDGVWQLSFRSLMWLQPAAYFANYNDLTKSTTTAVNQAVVFYSQNPDPGTSGGLAASTAAGWDEGTSLRRLSTLNCLYSLTMDTRLPALMQKEINVQQCPRYYGPPCNAVHNHGLLANQQIYAAGALTKNAAWTKLAADRLAAEAPQVFDAAGFMKEQSASYQAVNVANWASAAAMIRATHPTQAATIDKETAIGTKGQRWLTQPDGRTAQIGGSSNDLAGITDPDYAERYVTDDTYGWSVGRWSWTDPQTAFYVIRYGPPRAYHGTNDRPGVTWTDLGTRVLVEPGTYGSLATDPYVVYQNALTSQNVAVPTVGAMVNGAVTRAATTIRSTSHAHSFTDNLWPNRPHSRYVAVYRDGTPDHKILVRDTFNNDPAQTTTNNYVRQWFHLDPTWMLQSQTTKSAVFKAANGRTLTMATDGIGISSISRGTTSAPVHGWHFPNWQQKTAAVEICIRSYQAGTQSRVETTFAIS